MTKAGSVRGTKRNIDEVEDPSVPPASYMPPCQSHEAVPKVRSPAALSIIKHRSAEKKQIALNEEAFWSNWKDNRSKRPPPSLPAVSAADRIAAIRRKLRDSG